MFLLMQLCLNARHVVPYRQERAREAFLFPRIISRHLHFLVLVLARFSVAMLYLRLRKHTRKSHSEVGRAYSFGAFLLVR